VPALIMLAGIYYGAQYGGAITSILLNLPGRRAPAVTCLDGYPMARQGRGGAALAISGAGSFLAGCLGTLLIALAGPPLGEWALAFGSAEYFSLMLMGLVGSAVLTQGDAGERALRWWWWASHRARRHRRQLRACRATPSTCRSSSTASASR
jgi:TctA family transporter